MALILVAVVIIYRSMISFTEVVDNLGMLFFVSLGFWFPYDTARKKDRTKSWENKQVQDIIQRKFSPL